MAKSIMPWIEIRIESSADEVSVLSDSLFAFGAEAVTFQDGANQPIFEPSSTTPLIWQNTIVIGLFAATHSLESVLNFLKEKKLSYQLKKLDDQDWERTCQKSFPPQKFGKRLWVSPSWHSPPEKNAVNISLDPGLAFGTGTHPTTRLCLEWLEANCENQDLIIDYGCGSGILAIAALKLGVKKAIAVDIDPQALLTTKANAEQNLISPSKLVIQGSNEPIDQKSNILVANILANPLIELAPRFNIVTKELSRIILSGILTEQVDQVISAFRPWFSLNRPIFDQEWVLLEGIKT